MNNSKKNLQFTCRICGETEQIDRVIEPGFAEIAYDEIIEWIDPGKPLPSLDQEQPLYWEHSSTIPQEGTFRTVKVSFPFSFDIGERFHALFMPALSFFNGWEEYPEEIEQSAIVSCQIERIIEKNDYSAWIEINVFAVTRLADLIKKYPVQVSTELLENFTFPAEIRSFHDKNWSYYSYNIQGDFGRWKLIYTDTNDIRHLILMGKWDFHTHNVYLGNIVNDKNKEK